MEATISKIRKNSSAEMWVSLREFQGRQYVDLREHFFSTDDQQWHPNRKGIMLLPELVCQVIEGLEALQEVTELGTVAVIPKSAREEIQIGYREYERSRYGEVRAWYWTKDSEERKPGKGATFKLEMIEAMIDALRTAEEQLLNAK